MNCSWLLTSILVFVVYVVGVFLGMYIMKQELKKGDEE